VPKPIPRALLRAALLTWIVTPLAAQVADLRDIAAPPKPAKQAAELKILPSLLEPSRIARDPARGGLAAAAEKLAALGPEVADGERARVEIVGRVAATEAVAAAVAAHGGTVTLSRGKRVEASVPVASLEALSRAIPSTHHIVPLGFGQVVMEFEGQGTTIMNDLPYRDLGYDGTGIKIAVIDVGYQGLALSRNSDDAPASSTDSNLTATSFQSAQSGNHGRFVVETIFDHAPGAEYRLAKIASQTQAAQAVDDAVAWGADIISMSIGYIPEWEDGESELSIAADDAASQGILVFNSAGNSADRHWQGDFDDDDNDGYHAWNGNDDEALQVTLPAQGNATFNLIWDRSGGTDFDLFLYNVDATQVVASSTQGGTAYEGVNVTSGSNFSVTLQLVVERVSGPAVEFEVFGGSTTVMDQHIKPLSSVLSPSDASHANVISVGAVEQAMYGSDAGACCITAVYSSQGPTNGLQLVPDVCAPTSTSTSFATSFTGTSCACPHAAGLTAALWSVNPAGTASQVRNLMYEYAAAKDWGAVVGPDFFYGRGGVRLPVYADCNLNSFPDAFDIASGGSDDANDNGKPDECDPSGFAFGLLGPETVPGPQFALIATLDPSPLPTSPSPPVAGFDMVFGFDPAQVAIESVAPSPALLALLGGAPASFAPMVVPGAVGVACDFGLDPTGAPIALALDVRTEMLVIECSLVGGAGGPGGPAGPPEIAFGFENQPTGLLLPAVQKVRSPAAAGGTTEVSPLAIASLSFDAVEAPHHAFRFETGAGVLGAGEGEVFVEADPLGDAAFSLRWAARELLEPGVATTAASAAISVDPAVLVPLGASPAGAIEALAPDLFLVSLGTDGLGIDIVWSTAGVTSFAFGLAGAQVADIALETAPGALAGATDGVSTEVRFLVPGSLATATNRVVAADLDELPQREDVTVHLLASVPPGGLLRRGDPDGSGAADIGDAIAILGYLFLGATPPACFDAADVNDDAAVSIADPISLLGYLFQAGSEPPAPGPTTCGSDPTADALDCASGGC